VIFGGDCKKKKNHSLEVKKKRSDCRTALMSKKLEGEKKNTRLGFAKNSSSGLVVKKIRLDLGLGSLPVEQF